MEVIKLILDWNVRLIGAVISSYLIYLVIIHSTDAYRLWKQRRNFKPPF